MSIATRIPFKVLADEDLEVLMTYLAVFEERAKRNG